MDLDIFSKLTGRGIGDQSRLKMVFPEPKFDEMYRYSKARTLIDMHKRVFTEDVAKIVAHLADCEL